MEKLIKKLSIIGNKNARVNINDSNENNKNAISDKSYNNEVEELVDYLKLKLAGEEELLNTEERYLRYVKGIDIWEVNGVSYTYILQNIKTFLNIETNQQNLVKKLKLMRKIDKELKKVIDKM